MCLPSTLLVDLKHLNVFDFLRFCVAAYKKRREPREEIRRFDRAFSHITQVVASPETVVAQHLQPAKVQCRSRAGASNNLRWLSNVGAKINTQ